MDGDNVKPCISKSGRCRFLDYDQYNPLCIEQEKPLDLYKLKEMGCDKWDKNPDSF